jgi:hypothetical protein
MPYYFGLKDMLVVVHNGKDDTLIREYLGKMAVASHIDVMALVAMEIVGQTVVANLVVDVMGTVVIGLAVAALEEEQNLAFAHPLISSHGHCILILQIDSGSESSSQVLLSYDSMIDQVHTRTTMQQPLSIRF